jgi:tetratricopeptide (TPR) repeat protein
VRRLLIVAAALWVPASAAFADSDDALLFDACNIFYQAEDYERAADCYGSLVRDNVHNGPLHHNLGNAMLHLGRHGEAVYHYRQAQVFRPRDSELRSHLGKARGAAEVPELDLPRRGPGAALFFYDSLSIGELWAITGLLNVLLWTLLTIRLFRRGEILTWTAAVVAVALVVFGATALHKHAQLITQPSAVVLSGTAVGRSGMDREASEMFRLDEGYEVAVLARQQGWCEVELPSTKRGWVDCETLGILEYGWF